MLLFSNGFSKVGLFEGRVVSAGALLCPAAGVVLAVVVEAVEAGLLIVPLYRLRNDDATAELAVVSIAYGIKEYCQKGKEIVPIYACQKK